jgi:D-hexose-6-phosphate mutarotase
MDKTLIRYMQFSNCATNHFIGCNNRQTNFLTYFALNNIKEIKIPHILSPSTNNQFAEEANVTQILPEELLKE